MRLKPHWLFGRRDHMGGSPTVSGGVAVCTIVVPWLEAALLSEAVRRASHAPRDDEDRDGPDRADPPLS